MLDCGYIVVRVCYDVMMLWCYDVMMLWCAWCYDVMMCIYQQYSITMFRFLLDVVTIF